MSDGNKKKVEQLRDTLNSVLESVVGLHPQQILSQRAKPIETAELFYSELADILANIKECLKSTETLSIIVEGNVRLSELLEA